MSDSTEPSRAALGPGPGLAWSVREQKWFQKDGDSLGKRNTERKERNGCGAAERVGSRTFLGQTVRSGPGAENRTIRYKENKNVLI